MSEILLCSGVFLAIEVGLLIGLWRSEGRGRRLRRELTQMTTAQQQAAHDLVMSQVQVRELTAAVWNLRCQLQANATVSANEIRARTAVKPRVSPKKEQLARRINESNNMHPA